MGAGDRTGLVVRLLDTVRRILDKAFARWPRGVRDRNTLPTMLWQRSELRNHNAMHNGEKPYERGKAFSHGFSLDSMRPSTQERNRMNFPYVTKLSIKDLTLEKKEGIHPGKCYECPTENSSPSRLLMYNNVRWLSRGKVLERFVECFEEIKKDLPYTQLPIIPQCCHPNPPPPHTGRKCSI
ncbi:hypothetical protein QTO34_016468 [Cnephaeus nilssonii]|uniref:Uncharacterized protein n=1 Tax=Cnephaeus nilssonii TaxID=3371016 RepID=A0AA40I392_CNENI|nr:hypothetical protein QTO34_016468 [Eptesicus nilssonii]